MEAMIDNGEDWMEPLLEFRDLLADTQDPKRKAEVRRLKRRSGQVLRKTDGTDFIRGPYRFEFRQDLLRLLLRAQKKVQANGPNAEDRLILPEELRLIRRIWRTEEQDWEDSLPRIVEEETGEKFAWASEEGGHFGAAEKQLLDRACEENQVNSALVAKLLDMEKEFSGMSRRAGIFKRLESILNEEWRDEEEILGTESAEQE